MKYVQSVICLLMTLQVFAQENPKTAFVVGTYAYKGLDRGTAIQPIADALGAVVKGNVTIRVFTSPTQLAEAFFSEEAQIIVPNLAGFAQIAARQKNDFLLFLPDSEGSTYKSSVVLSAGKTPFLQRLNEQKHKIGMVWADSTSGAILGKDYLQKQLSPGEKLRNDRILYLGRHENVLAALLANEVDIGVLATDVYLQQNTGLTEIWRSEVLPFGPVLCSKAITETCYALQQLVMNKPGLRKQVLNHLIKGWPEFGSASDLVMPQYSAYEAFIEHFENQQQ